VHEVVQVYITLVIHSQRIWSSCWLGLLFYIYIYIMFALVTSVFVSVMRKFI
jgi:hypothetical protein